MGLDALVRADDGGSIAPSSQEDWQEWVSASATRNFLLNDPLLDWLEHFGEMNGFAPDTARPGYDPRLDFTEYIFRQGDAFEQAVLRHLRTLTEVVSVCGGPADIRSLAKAEETFGAMQTGVPIIYQGALRNPGLRTYGAPDVLVRSDELRRLFPSAIAEDEAGIPAPDLLGARWHYRVLDIKFTTLHLLAGGQLGNAGSAPAYKGQLYLYNLALGRLQGYTPPEAFLLGRGWERTVKGVSLRGRNCMDLVAPVPQTASATGSSLGPRTLDACDWLRRMRRDGANWHVLPHPEVSELWPNMKNIEDAPWHGAKRDIGHALEDLTLLWQVGVDKRERAHGIGIYRWTDPRGTAAAVGVTGAKQQPILQALLDVNRAEDGPAVLPTKISAEAETWRTPGGVEFYVDFETTTDLDDDFTAIPNKGGQPLIFMVGCGHMEQGEWQFRCFIVGEFTEVGEAIIIEDWLRHMNETRARLDPAGPQPLVIHWSNAEVSTFESAFNSARERHPAEEWVSPRWFDFLKQVIREEPVVVRGALGFGLKAVAKALHQHGVVQKVWEDGPADGLGAMVGAWWSVEEARRLGVPFNQVDLVHEIASYNEVDCKVMMEIVGYLREHH